MYSWPSRCNTREGVGGRDIYKSAEKGKEGPSGKLGRPITPEAQKPCRVFSKQKFVKVSKLFRPTASVGKKK